MAPSGPGRPASSLHRGGQQPETRARQLRVRILLVPPCTPQCDSHSLISMRVRNATGTQWKHHFGVYGEWDASLNRQSCGDKFYVSTVTGVNIDASVVEYNIFTNSSSSLAQDPFPYLFDRD